MALLRATNKFMTLSPRFLNITRNFIIQKDYLIGRNIPVKKKAFTQNAKATVMVLPFRSCSTPEKELVRVSVTFITPQGQRILVEGECENLIEFISQDYSDDFTGFGACGGGCSCATCLVCMKPEDYLYHSDSRKNQEAELVDTKWENIGPHCRLICQLELEKMNGLEVTIVDQKLLKAAENTEQLCG